MKKERALEILRKRYAPDGVDDTLRIALETLIPELTEKEDERVRKWLYNYISNCPNESFEFYGGVGKDAVLAWLEKQKEQNGEDKKCVDFTIYHPLKNGKGKYECIPYSFNGSLTSFSEDKDLIDFLRTCFYTKEECNEWIERQKEQRPAEWSEDFGKEVESVHKRYPEVSFAKLTRIAHHFAKWADKYKSTEWSEEDEKNLELVIDCIYEFYPDPVMKYKLKDWLKSLPLNLKKKNEDVAKLCSNEWSEEDEKVIEAACALLCEYAGYYKEKDMEAKNLQLFKVSQRLKSLRPQPKDETYKEKDEAFKFGKHQLAIGFMNYLDENRPEGKMNLSNGECEDIDKAFKENDWAKIMRYVEKYSSLWKPSEEQMEALKKVAYNLVGTGTETDIYLVQLYEQLKKL